LNFHININDILHLKGQLT